MTRRALLIHGLSSSGATWWRVREQLESEGWEVTTPDLRGHGTAERAESYAITDYVSDLPSGPWDLVIGHSLGGAIAAVAATSPGFAVRVVLLDPVLEVPEKHWQAVLEDQLGELDLTAETVARERPHWHPRDRELKVQAVHQADRRMVERTFSDNPGWNVVAAAKALPVPTLILGADHAVYSMFAAETADAVVAANPSLTYRVIEGAGHSPHRDKPEATLAAIHSFLESGD